MSKTGGEALVESLKAKGVEVVFCGVAVSDAIANQHGVLCNLVTVHFDNFIVSF